MISVTYNEFKFYVPTNIYTIMSLVRQLKFNLSLEIFSHSNVQF